MQYSFASAPSAPAHELSSSAALCAALCFASKYPAPLYWWQTASSHILSSLLFEKMQQIMIITATITQTVTPTATYFFSLALNPSSGCLRPSSDDPPSY